MSSDFEIVCEIEPPVTADLGIVREQIAILQPTCDAFLVPDSHLGRATVSSIAVAHEVKYLAGRAIAVLNARDRNLLGLQRDLLTAGAYGVDELLFVYGDRPQRGERTGLKVREMLEEAKAGEVGRPFRIGVTADVNGELPDWKRAADFVFTQISFDEDAVAAWRERTGFDGAVYAGVMVLASEKMARRLMDLIPGFTVPDRVLRALEQDRSVGVELAVEQVLRLKQSAAVDGVHLIPARAYRPLAQTLEAAGL